MNVYILTRVDVDYVARCDKFDTYEEAVEAAKEDFNWFKFKWENRISMISGDPNVKTFPIRECDGGEHEWDIHEIEI